MSVVSVGSGVTTFVGTVAVDSTRVASGPSSLTPATGGSDVLTSLGTSSWVSSASATFPVGTLTVAASASMGALAIGVSTSFDDVAATLASRSCSALGSEGDGSATTLRTGATTPVGVHSAGGGSVLAGGAASNVSTGADSMTGEAVVSSSRVSWIGASGSLDSTTASGSSAGSVVGATNGSLEGTRGITNVLADGWNVDGGAGARSDA